MSEIEKDKDTKPKKKRKALRIVLIILAVIFGLVIIAAIVAVIFANSLLNLMPRKPENFETMTPEQMEQFLKDNTEEIDPDFTGEVLSEEDLIWETVEFDPIPQGHVINFLLIGKDFEVGGYSRTDSMILCTINKSTKEITLTSFMRDLYLKLANGYSGRINSGYVIGGVDLLKETIEKSFGVEIHGTFEVDFTAFKDVIDLVGGVEVTMTKAEANYMSKHVEGSKKIFEEGTYLLNGNEALAYARMRQVGLGDFTRTERQRTIIETVYKKCYTMSVTELYKLMEKVLPMITTNLTNGQIMSYAAQLLPMLSDLDLNANSRIPADGTYKMAMVNKMSVLIGDLNANRKLLEEIMEPA